MITLSPKQQYALDLIEYDPNYTQILTGGSGGPGKTLGGCTMQIERRWKHPGTRGFLARETLVDLKKTTLMKFFDTLETEYPFIKYEYHESMGYIEFVGNKSRIDLMALAYRPRDPDYNWLGGYEFTDGFIDEVGETKEKAFTKIFGRIRYKLPPIPVLQKDGSIVWHKGKPKLLMASNPSNNWLKYTWVQDKKGKPVVLKPHQKFIRSLLDDNPDKDFVEQYKGTLLTLPEYDRKRLLYGDWNYLENNDPFIVAFNPDKHIGEISIDQNYPLRLSFDFNYKPTTCTIYQKTHLGLLIHRVIQIDGGTRLLCQEVKNYRNHWTGIIVTGDVSGSAKTSRSGSYPGGDAFTDYQIIEKELSLRGDEFINTTGVNGLHEHSRRLVNYIFMHFPVIINNTEENSVLIQEIQNAKTTGKGGLVKDDNENRNDAFDSFRYACNEAFPEGIDSIDHDLRYLINAA